MSVENASVGGSEMSMEGSSTLKPAAWVISISVACLLSWGLYTFPPVVWRIPDDMSHIGALSSQADQARLAAVVNANGWKNSLLKFGLAGLGIGFSGVILYGAAAGRNIVPVIATLVTGIVAGEVAGALGLVTRRYLDLEYPIPMISDQMRPLFCDIVVLALVSMILMVPIAVLLAFQPASSERKKAIAPPLAGLVTGLIVPFAGAMILSAETSTRTYPPAGMDLLILWFVTLAAMAILFVVFLGQKTPVEKVA